MDEAASLAKQKSHLEDEYMYFSDILEDEKEEAREIGLAEGRAKGLAEGLETGRQQKAVEVAKNAISMGLSEHQVVAISGLSVDEVRQLIKGQDS